MLQVTQRRYASAWTQHGAARAPWASLLLALALCLGGAGSTPSAQAARAAEFNKKIYLFLDHSSGGESTICVGDKIDVRARVLAVVEVINDPNDPNPEKQFAGLYGVPLQASVTDPGIGVISPASAVTSVGGDPAGQANFTFTAKKPGTTTVKVDARLIHKQLLGVVLSSDTLTDQFSLTVQKCAYRVDATGVWHMEGKITLIAEITNAPLAPDGAGKYAGNADVTWFAETKYPRPCYIVHHPPPSHAYITGELIGTRLLQVKVIWEPTAALAGTMFCPSQSAPLFVRNDIAPDDSRFWVPTSGGTARRQPALSTATTIDRTAIFTVIPEPGQ